MNKTKYLLLFIFLVGSFFLLAHFAYITRYTARKTAFRLVQSLRLVNFNKQEGREIQQTLTLTENGNENVEHEHEPINHPREPDEIIKDTVKKPEDPKLGEVQALDSKSDEQEPLKLDKKETTGEKKSLEPNENKIINKQNLPKSSDKKETSDERKSPRPGDREKETTSNSKPGTEEENKPDSNQSRNKESRKLPAANEVESPSKSGQLPDKNKKVREETASKNKVGPPVCPKHGRALVGGMFVDQSIPEMYDLEKQMSVKYGGTVEKGGWWRPSDCKARTKVAILIPYRNRIKQLQVFLRHMHPVLQRQLLDYRIFIIEQAANDPFNRAGLFNIGFKEALKVDDYDCFIFSDVDLLPEDDRNSYGCPTSPRHMSVAIDKFNYQLPYASIFGGVGAFKRKDFEAINGFSNMFWGWGGEDDDLYQRITAKGYQLSRPSLQIGRYTMIRIHHFQSHGADPNRQNLLQNSAGRMHSDGLSTLRYERVEVKELPLVTVVTVNLRKW